MWIVGLLCALGAMLMPVVTSRIITTKGLGREKAEKYRAGASSFAIFLLIISFIIIVHGYKTLGMI